MTARDRPKADELAARISELGDQVSGMLEEIQHLRAEVRALRADGGPDGEAFPGERAEVPEVAGGTPVEVPEASQVIDSVAPCEVKETSQGTAGAGEASREEAEEGSEAALVAASEGFAAAVPAQDSPADDAVPLAVEVPRARAASRRALDIETRIGSYWLNRIGLVSLIIGFAFLAREVEPMMQAWHRVVAGYLGAAALFAVGRRYEERLQQFARPLTAGGLALGFFVSFAAYFLPRMACMPLPVSLVSMALFVGGIFAFAERWGSQATAGLALFLGHVAAYVASADTATLPMVAVLFLSATAVGLMVRHDWLPLSLFSVLAAFSSHLLWTLRDGELAGRPERFGLNFLFLTAYYLIFLFADGLFFHRLARRGAEAFSRRQRLSGRNVGPTALLAYATQVALLFQMTGNWSRIHLFLLPLAALQLAVLLYHRRQGSSDSPLYLTAATTFVTLGLFSITGGLALNMALAAEALLLLVLGRAIDFWFLRPLAQSILALNFVHFWFSDAKELTSWPLFAGAVLMASVYFVKAWLNETWRPIAEDQRWTTGEGSRRWRRFYERLSVPIAHWQTFAGAVLLTYQCDKFLGAPANGLALAMLASLGAAAGLRLRSSPVLQGVGLLQLGCALVVCRQALAPTAAATLDAWTLNHVAALLIAWVAAAALAVAHRRQRRRFIRFASLALPAAVVCAFAAAVAGATPLSLGRGGFSWLALATPLALWLAIEVWPRPRIPIVELTDRQRRFYAGGRWRRVAASLFTSVLAVWGAAQAAGSGATALWVLSGVTLVLAAAAFLRGSPYLLIGLLTHQPLTIAFSLWVLDSGSSDHALLRWWILTEAVASAAVLLAACPLWRRGSYALGGLTALAQALAMFSWLALLPDQRFSPIGLWLLPAAGLFVGIELFRSSPARCPVTLPGWADRWGERFLLDSSRGIAGVAAVLSAAALGLMLGRAFPSQVPALWSMMGAALVMLGACLWRNSPYLMAALLTLLGLATAHRLLYGGELVHRPRLEWASVTVLTLAAAVLLAAAPRRRRASFAWGGVLTLTLGLVAVCEFLFNQRPGPSPSALWLVTLAAAWWAAEELWRGFWGAEVDGGTWHDILDIEPLRKRSLALAMGFSTVLSLLLIALTWRQFPSPVAMIYVTLLYAVVFVVLTGVLRSPALAAGFAVCLSGAHPLFYFRVGPASAAGVSPLLALLLLGVTLAAGVAAEWIFRHYDAPGRRRPAWWGAWYPYFLGFLLALLFLGPYGERVFEQPAFGAPVQMALAVLAVLLARWLGLRWLTRAALAYAVIVVMQLLAAALWNPAYRGGLVLVGVLVFVELVTMERVIAGQDPMVLSLRSPRLVRWQRWTLIAAAGAEMVFCLFLSRELRGSWTTAGWSVLALLLMTFGFLWHSRAYRRLSLAIFSLALLRLFVFDVASLETHYLMLVLICVGVCLIAVSYLYARFKEEIHRWL